MTINVGLLKSKIEELVNQRTESKTKVFINSGVGKDFFSNLNKGQIPSVEKIMSLADYLDVSVDYLLGRTEETTGIHNTQNNTNGNNNISINKNESAISEIGQEMLKILESLPTRERINLLKMAYDYQEEYTKKWHEIYLIIRGDFMGAYAIYSDKPFRTNSKIQTKRKRGRIDDLMEMVKGAYLETDKKTGDIKLMRNGETLGVFKDEDE